MRGQPENLHDVGIGKKVEAETSPELEWKKVPGKQYHYVNSKGQKAYCPPVPDVPQHGGGMADIWREYLRRQAQQQVEYYIF
jgi:hypothetical protein